MTTCRLVNKSNPSLWTKVGLQCFVITDGERGFYYPQCVKDFDDSRLLDETGKRLENMGIAAVEAHMISGVRWGKWAFSDEARERICRNYFCLLLLAECFKERMEVDGIAAAAAWAFIKEMENYAFTPVNDVMSKCDWLLDATESVIEIRGIVLHGS